MRRLLNENVCLEENWCRFHQCHGFWFYKTEIIRTIYIKKKVVWSNNFRSCWQNADDHWRPEIQAMLEDDFFFPIRTLEDFRRMKRNVHMMTWTEPWDGWKWNVVDSRRKSLIDQQISWNLMKIWGHDKCWSRLWTADCENDDQTMYYRVGMGSWSVSFPYVIRILWTWLPHYFRGYL